MMPSFTTPRRISRMIVRFGLMLSVVSVAGTQVVDAQQPRTARPDSLPREFVEALLGPAMGFYGGTTTQFVIGKVPPTLAPFLYVPPGARVLGGIESMGSTIAVFAVPMSLEELRTTYQREQLKLGWTLPPTMEAVRGWGFMQAPGANANGGLDFCHIGQSLQLNPTPGPSGGLLVSARVQNYQSACSQPTRVGGRPPASVELPVLYNPTGATMSPPECYANAPGFGGTNGTSERLRTGLTPSQLADHFAKQLADSGWLATAQSVAVHRTWTRPDSVGFEREVTLTITPGGVAGCQDLVVQVRRMIKR